MRGAKVASADPHLPIEDALRTLTRALLARAGDHGTARLEAEVLLAHVLGIRRAGLLLLRVVPSAAFTSAGELVQRRAATGEPVAYLCGRREFGELELSVDRRVLVPRPETELVVEVFERRLRDGGVQPGVVIDRGTGSGNLALSVCRWRRVLACDLSAEALDVARRNVDAAGARARVTLVHADGLGWLAAGAAAAVVANPPYVEPAGFDALPDDVRLHEPRLALVPGEGSVAAMYARLLRESRAALAPGGWLITELGAGQAGLVTALASQAGFGWTALHRDLSGHERVLAARRS